MFANLIADIEKQIVMLNQKKTDLLSVSDLSEEVLDDIRRVLTIVEPYQEEKQQFIDNILKIVNVDSTMLVNYRSQPTTTEQEDTSVIVHEYPSHPVHQLFEYDGKHCVYFQNMKSKNGSNSLKVWESHIKSQYPSLNITSVKIENPVNSGRFLMMIDTCSDEAFAYLRNVDFAVRPENQMSVEEYTSVTDVVVDESPVDDVIVNGDIETVAAPVNYFPDVDEVVIDEPQTEQVEVIVDELETVEEPQVIIETPYIEETSDDDIDEVEEVEETNDNDDVVEEVIETTPVLRLQRLESNKRVAKNPNNTSELYISFDINKGFGNESNLELWDNFLDKNHNSLLTESVQNWEGSGLEGKYLLRVISANITKLLEIVKYDFELTPMKARLALGEITAHNENDMKLIEFGIDPDADFNLDELNVI